MIYKEAIAAGYAESDSKWARGYVSRKINVNDQQVFLAGGRRKGYLYVLTPGYGSTRYCRRQYLYRPNAVSK
jgi:hypothetical protein